MRSVNEALLWPIVVKVGYWLIYLFSYFLIVGRPKQQQEQQELEDQEEQ